MEFGTASGRLQPGFRFDPTDVELIVHYLKRKVVGRKLEPEVIAEIDIYQFHPEDLRERACLKKDLIWYFFCAKERKYGNGDRIKRATHFGFWKSTGKDRVVSYRERMVGKVKTLVFHQGKSKEVKRTDWVMHEYRIEDDALANKGISQDSYVLCKIFKKSGRGPRNGEQYGAPYIEEEWDEEEEEEEITNNAPMVPVAVQDPSASVPTNSAVINGSISLSAVDQAPTPTSDLANVASTSKGVVPDFDHPVDDAPVPIPKAVDTASTSKVASPNDDDDDDDDIDALLGTFHADEFGGIFDNLEDLGINMTDLDTPLKPWP